jgi:hypothetical protein
MVDPKLAMIATALALSAAPALAQDDPGACDRCAAPHGDLPPAVYAQPPRFQSDGRVYVTRSETVTRASYSEGYLSWPGKDTDGGVPGFAPQYGPQSIPCPPVRPGERVISCRYVPIAQQADIAPMGGVLYADGGVGPEYIAGGGGGGGTTIIEGGASASSSSSASASASAIASANVSVLIEERQKHKPKGGGYSPPPPSGGGYWPPGSMTPPSGGSWAPGSMSGGGSLASNDRYGSWPSGGMGSGSGGVGGGHGASHPVSHTTSHGHGRR